MKEEMGLSFTEFLRGLLAGDFSRLAPQFEAPSSGASCPVVRWFDEGLFAGESDALSEAFTCACFNGSMPVVNHLLAKGVDPNGGIRTGLNAFHWAANRGHLGTVRILIQHRSALERLNAYGGTVLGCAVWSAVNEPRPGQLQIIEALLNAGAIVGAAECPSGDARVDEVLRRFRERDGGNW